MNITDPFWLVLAIPLAMSLWLWPLPSRLMFGLAVLVVGAVAVGAVRLEPAAAGPLGHGRVGGRPQSFDAAGKRFAGNGGGRHRSFDHAPETTSWPWCRSPKRRPSSNRPRRASSPVSRPRSAARPRAWPTRSTWPCRLIGRDEPGRILVLSDGRWTGRDCLLRRPERRRRAWPSTTAPSNAPAPATWPSNASRDRSRSCRASRS